MKSILHQNYKINNLKQWSFYISWLSCSVLFKLKSWGRKLRPRFSCPIYKTLSYIWYKELADLLSAPAVSKSSHTSWAGSHQWGRKHINFNGLLRLTVPSFPPERKGEHPFLPDEGEVHMLGKRERHIWSGERGHCSLFQVIFTGCAFWSPFSCLRSYVTLKIHNSPNFNDRHLLW